MQNVDFDDDEDDYNDVDGGNGMNFVFVEIFALSSPVHLENFLKRSAFHSETCYDGFQYFVMLQMNLFMTE